MFGATNPNSTDRIQHRPGQALLPGSGHAQHPRTARNETGAIVWQWYSDAFGNTTTLEDPDGDGTGHPRQPALPGAILRPRDRLALQYGKVLHPDSGRYLQPDPIGLQGGINTYSYVGGNPVNAVDPLGLYDIFIGGKGDNTSGIVRRYHNDFAKKNPKRWASYFQHDSDALMDAIRRAKKEKPCEPINIVGHSYGGDTAAGWLPIWGKKE